MGGKCTYHQVFDEQTMFSPRQEVFLNSIQQFAGATVNQDSHTVLLCRRSSWERESGKGLDWGKCALAPIHASALLSSFSDS